MSSDGLLTVKWVGDSRCVIQRRDGSVHALTTDHAAATHREEGLRIEKAGGAVEGAYVAAPRAEGLLQVTRSLGDRAHHLDDVVLATPEVVSVSVEDAAFAVVATDGVWAFVDDEVGRARRGRRRARKVGRRRRGRRRARDPGAGAGRGVAARRATILPSSCWCLIVSCL